MSEMSEQWLAWARELQAMGQIGLTYSQNPYDRATFARLLEIAAEIVHSRTGLGVEALLERFQIEPGYATAKVDVRAAVVRDGRILLVRERQDGRWCMPGGWADVGEYPSRMVAREVCEESGFEVRPAKVVGVFDANRGGEPMSFFYAYKIVFLCELLGGKARPSVETLDVGFFDFDDLPELSCHRTNERHLAEVRAHIENPARPAAFD